MKLGNVYVQGFNYIKAKFLYITQQNQLADNVSCRSTINMPEKSNRNKAWEGHAAFREKLVTVPYLHKSKSWLNVMGRRVEAKTRSLTVWIQTADTSRCTTLSH
jgi:hypothetical protein